MPLDTHAITETVFVTGMKGTGKTQYLVSVAKRFKGYVFAFDHDGHFAERLGVASCHNQLQLRQLVTRKTPVIFKPFEMFYANKAEGLDWFSRLVFNLSERLPGDKLFICDEFQKTTDTGKGGITEAEALIGDDGRKRRINAYFMCQGANELNHVIRKQLTRIRTYRHEDPLQLKWLKERGFDVEAVKGLKKPGGYLDKEY